MIDILGFIGFVVTMVIIIPASISALIRVFSHPIVEIKNLWLTLIDQVIDIIQSVKEDFRKE